MEDRTGSEVEWNMAALVNMELAKLNSEANTAAISGNYSKAVACQLAKKQSAGFTFSEEERAKLKEMENKFNILLLKVRGIHSWNEEERIEGSMAEIELRSLYDSYVELLNDLLDKYGWFGGRKKDATRIRV